MPKWDAGWINQNLMWLVIGLWITASAFLVAGFSKSIYINSRTILVTSSVTATQATDGGVWIDFTTVYGGIQYYGYFWSGYIGNASQIQNYIDRYWPIGSIHPCLLVNESYLSFTIANEYWILWIAGILLVLSLVIAIGMVVYGWRIQKKRKEYRDLDDRDKDFILITTKDLDSEMRKGDYPSTCGRSAMDSFDEALALFWIFMPLLKKRFSDDKINILRDFQIKCLVDNSAASRFQFQQDVNDLLVQLG